MNEELMRNIDTEIAMLREISSYVRRVDYSNPVEQKLLVGAINSLRASMTILNKSVPEILKEIAPARVLPSGKKIVRKKGGLENVSYNRSESKVKVVLSSKSKEKFLKELSISEGFIKKLKKKKREKGEKYAEFKAARGYLKLANKVFLPQASKFVRLGYFKSLSVGLRKANV